MPGSGEPGARGARELSERQGVGAVFVVGHPASWPRFGFSLASGFGITCEFDGAGRSAHGPGAGAGCPARKNRTGVLSRGISRNLSTGRVALVWRAGNQQLVRIAIRGSTRAARRAGSHAASRAVIVRSTAETPRIRGSQGLTPNASDDSHRPSRSAPAVPAARPATRTIPACRRTVARMSDGGCAKGDPDAEFRRALPHRVGQDAIESDGCECQRPPKRTRPSGRARSAHGSRHDRRCPPAPSDGSTTGSGSIAATRARTSGQNPSGGRVSRDHLRQRPVPVARELAMRENR